MQELFGKPVKRKVELLQSSVELEFPILKGREIAKLLEISKNGKNLKPEDVEDLVFKVIKHNYPDGTKTTVKDMPIINIVKILNTLLDVNGFPTGSDTPPLDKTTK